jgi:hypothetical protein
MAMNEINIYLIAVMVWVVIYVCYGIWFLNTKEYKFLKNSYPKKDLLLASFSRKSRWEKIISTNDHALFRVHLLRHRIWVFICFIPVLLMLILFLVV